MNNGLVIVGVVAMVFATVAGVAARVGARLPVLNAFSHQVMLFTLGTILLGTGLVLSPATPSAGRDVAEATGAPAGDSGDTCAGEPFDCLPSSAGPVTFVNPAAAKAMAYRNFMDGLSAVAASAAAVKRGATGKAASLCGVVASAANSPLGKHDAALRLLNPPPGDGQADAACRKMAQAYL